ncbi:MAG: LytTR family transcriptional regulator DNA-binding domain-containing protein [Prevotella sp.]|nr:LytTR family transcriptional regulator DNA-binding domain-containing protein [Prevotella sp.]
MANLYFNNRDELIRIDTDLVAAIQANGNYSRVVYITKREFMLTHGISKLESVFQGSNDKRNKFVRLGRSFIVNHAYFQKIDMIKQQLILCDGDKNEIRITLPKQILKSYKTAIGKSIKKR